MSEIDYKCKIPDIIKQRFSALDEQEGYVPPIKMVMGDLMARAEDSCVKYCQQVGFDVDKEELTKALQYDRGQYDKGFDDGVKYARRELAESLEEILVNYIRQECVPEILNKIMEGK